MGDYLRLRRSLGYKLHDHARLLRRFADHLDAIGAEFVTTELALSWALEPDVPPGSVVPAMRLLPVPAMDALAAPVVRRLLENGHDT